MTETTRIEQLLSELGIIMTTIFVPWSQSRNKNEKQPSLNWSVTLLRHGKPFLITDYMMGSGHCEASKASIRELGSRNCIMRDEALREECERGRPMVYGTTLSWYFSKLKGKPYEPKLADVVYSLVSDAEALDYPTFEDWANSLGFEPDSRKAETIYRACLEIGLKLRATLGENGLSSLKEAFQDY